MSVTSRNPLILTQIATRLNDIFDGHIDLSDVSSKPIEEQKRFFTSRAYTALYFLDEIGLSPAEAAACVTDGGADDGIDAVYVDTKNARIFLAQAKWRVNMEKGIELTDFTRFRDGVRNVISLSWTEGNANLHRFRSTIEQQLSNIDTEVVMVMAHTSGQQIAKNISAVIKKFMDEQNIYNSNFINFKEFRVAEAAKVARSHSRPENINFSLMLANWGLFAGPYRAIYGSVAASDVIQWLDQYGNKLFAENLRYGIDKSDVNDGIVTTAHNDPDSFWYYNNGITAVCDSVEKKPIGGPDTSTGIFDLTKVSVINGAQTITSLNKAKQAGADLSRIRIHFRVISLDNTPEDFAGNVTSANNTQNDLNPVDFVAADPNQDRIRREAAQSGIVYTYRRGDKEPERSHGFTIRSATVAAACASGDLRLAVSAKRYISGLWENTKREPYTRIFNAETSAIYLWRAVRVMNAVDDALMKEGGKLSGREKLTSVHGNRFILFYVFNSIGKASLGTESEVLELEERGRILTGKILKAINRIIANKFAEAYPGNIFKNQERQAELLLALSLSRRGTTSTKSRKRSATNQ